MLTNFYDSDEQQMRHCEPCEMPQAVIDADDMASYSLVKHAIIEVRECHDKPDDIEHMRRVHEARGTLGVFNAALQCMRCAEGVCLIIDGQETAWRIGGTDS